MSLTISIILRIHNREEFYKEAINSIIEQNFDKKRLELIIATNVLSVVEYIKTFRDLKYLVSFYKDGTEGEVLYSALKIATGSIICFLDDDDLWSKDRLLTVSNAFLRFNNLGYFHNSVLPFKEDKFIDRKKYEIIPKYGNFYVKNLDKSLVIRKITEYYPDFNMSSICIDKKILKNHMDDLKLITTSPDTFLYFCALESCYDLFLCTDSMTFYRHHDLNLTTNDVKNEKWNNSIIESHEKMFVIFKAKDTYLERLILRRLLLTKIQNSLRSRSVSRRDALKYSVEYLHILFSFFITVDALVFGLAIFSTFSHKTAQRVYLKFV